VLERRGHGRERCAVCGLHLRLCICAELPVLETRTRILLITHARETRRTSNTGGLITRCLPNSALLVHGERGAPEPELRFVDGERVAVLFPAPGAIPLDRFVEANATPMTLVVPDGTWAQASRMRLRVPGVAALPCLTLPVEPPSPRRLRAADRRTRLATLEAVARALGILEGEPVRTALEHVFRIKTERTLWMRGELDRSQVTGGIPAHIERHAFP